MDDEASVSERLVVEEHLKSCAACTEGLQQTRGASALLFEILREDQLSSDLTERVMAHLPEMAPATSMKAALRRQVVAEGKRTRHWFGVMVRLMPVLTPIVLLILGGLLWFAWPSHYGLEDENVIGMITQSDANADAVHFAYGRRLDARVHAPIFPGDRFETGRDSLLLSLDGPSHVTVYENTVLEVLGPREIQVTQGSVFFEVFRESYRFQVRTPDGLVTTLGTTFQVSVQNAGTEVTVVNGEVLIENDTDFVRINRSMQALFSPVEQPTVTRGIDTRPFVRRARALRPNPDAERRFLTRFVNSTERIPAIKEQVFMVDTEGRKVNILMLNWTPDPYTGGHAGYTVYVSDSAMNPLFKSAIPSDTFQNKDTSSVRIEIPEHINTYDTGMLHITVVPEHGRGLVETRFTEVAAIGEA